MTGWIWVVFHNMRCYVEIIRYNRRNDTYIVKFATGDVETFSGNDVFEWNKGA